MCVDVKKGVLWKRNLTTKKQQHPPPPDLDFTTNEMANNGKMARKAQRGNRGETEHIYIPSYSNVVPSRQLFLPHLVYTDPPEPPGAPGLPGTPREPGFPGGPIKRICKSYQPLN